MAGAHRVPRAPDCSRRFPRSKPLPCLAEWAAPTGATRRRIRSAASCYVMNQDFPPFYRLEKEERARAPAANSGPQQFTRAQINTGETAYKLYCQVCHGGDRQGGNNGPALLTAAGQDRLQRAAHHHHQGPEPHAGSAAHG